MDEWEKYIFLDIPNAKHPRRESASLVDEFFGDTKDSPELQAAKKMISAGLSRGGADHLNLLKTGLLNATKQQIMQHAMTEGQRRQSSSLVDEFFGKDGLPSPKLPEDRNKGPGLQSTKFQNGFDMDATYVMNEMPVSSEKSFLTTSTPSSTASTPASVSMWDNIRNCINITEDRDSEVEMDDAASVPVIKVEDASDKPSCQFHNSSFDSVHIKQENPSSCMLTETSNSEHYTIMDPLDRPKTLNIPVPQSIMSSTASAHYGSQYSSGGLLKTHGPMPHNYSSTPTPPHTVPVLMPPTPPGSHPSSPIPGMDIRRTPPPPYPGPIPSSRISLPNSVLNLSPMLSIPTPGVQRSPKKAQKTHPGCSTIKYNRKNNPDLEKRRIHFCDFPGKLHSNYLYVTTSKFYTGAIGFVLNMCTIFTLSSLLPVSKIISGLAYFVCTILY